MSNEEQIKELERRRDEMYSDKYHLCINNLLEEQEFYDNNIFKLKQLQKDGNNGKLHS
jgi:hypothetical protein